MARSSDSDDDRKKRKKKKKKRSKSRSGSPDSRHSHKHKKSKKSKSKHRSESRSRESSRRRSRSYSKGRSDISETSRPYDRRRSRSRSYDRRRSRSRSYDRRRSRSRSRERYSRRLSRSGSKSRRQSSSPERRSGSRSRDRYSSKSSRRRSRDRSRERYQRSHSESKTDRSEVKEDSCTSIPGFSEMTPAEQTRMRMQMALKAAAAADEKLRGHAEGQKVGSQRSFEESLKFTQAVQDIEGTGFAPQVFKSSRSDKKNEKVESKDEFTFGTAGELRLDMIQRKPLDIDVNNEELAHPDFFGNPEEKIQRWIQKLSAMRRKKLEGEVLT